MFSFSDDNQADVAVEFNSTSKYIDDLPNINNPYFKQMVSKIYPNELQLNKSSSSSDTKAHFLDLDLSITKCIFSTKISDKSDDFNFEIIVNFLFLDGYVPRSTSYGVYISQLTRFARVCSNVVDFNNRNTVLTY